MKLGFCVGLTIKTVCVKGLIVIHSKLVPIKHSIAVTTVRDTSNSLD